MTLNGIHKVQSVLWCINIHFYAWRVKNNCDVFLNYLRCGHVTHMNKINIWELKNVTRRSRFVVCHTDFMSNSTYYKVKWSRYKPGVGQRLGRGIALLSHDRGTRRRWVVSSTLRPHFTPGKDPVPILREASWAPGPVWTGGNSRPHRD